MRIRVVAFFTLFLMLMGSAQAQTLLSEFTGGTGATGWSFAWMRFETSAIPGQGLHSVELELEHGGNATGEVRLEVYASSSGIPVCAPQLTNLFATSDTVTIPIGRAFATFSFAGQALSPNTPYFIALRDDSPDGIDQFIFLDVDSTFTEGGSAGNCGQLNHRIFVQPAVVPPAPAVAIPFLSLPTSMLLAVFMLLLGFGHFRAGAGRGQI